MADIALNTVAKIEAGESKHPTIQTMVGIAKALGVSLDDLAKECSKEISDKKT